MLFSSFLPIRDSVPLDVLAQFQLRHHRPRRRTAQSCHQHVPGSGLLRAHHRGHLQHARQAREAGYGDCLLKAARHCLGSLITDVLLFLAGAHPKRHAGRRCCHGNISRVHDHPLWFSDRGFLLRHPLHLWLHLRHGELVCLFDFFRNNKQKNSGPHPNQTTFKPVHIVQICWQRLHMVELRQKVWSDI